MYEMCTHARAHVYLPAGWADVKHNLSETTCPRVPTNLSKVQIWPRFCSERSTCPSFCDKISYLVGPVNLFPRPSYTDTDAWMVIEVDAPLRRSHYDWFRADKGCKDPTFPSSHTRDKGKQHHRDKKHKQRQTVRNWLCYTVTAELLKFKCLSICFVLFSFFSPNVSETQYLAICGESQNTNNQPPPFLLVMGRV